MYMFFTAVGTARYGFWAAAVKELEESLSRVV